MSSIYNANITIGYSSAFYIHATLRKLCFSNMHLMSFLDIEILDSRENQFYCARIEQPVLRGILYRPT